MKIVYCEVETESLNKAVCASSLNGFDLYKFNSLMFWIQFCKLCNIIEYKKISHDTISNKDNQENE